MLKMFNIWITAVLAVATFLTGCINDPVSEDCTEEEPLAGDVYIRFRMNLNNGGMPGGTRAEGGSEPETPPATPVTPPVTPPEDTPGMTPAMSREKVVETIDLFVYDAGSSELLDIVSIDDPGKIADVCKEDGMIVPVRIKKARTVHIYVAANLPERARMMFGIGMVGNDVPFVAEGKTYRDVIEELIPDSNGMQKTLESNNGCIPMTGQFIIGDGSKDIAITNDNATQDNPLKVTADIRRIVSKIHVLAQYEAHDSGDYVFARDRSRGEAVASDEEYADWIGWILLKNVRYMPNGMNKSTYIFAQPNEKTNPLSTLKDWNMDLDRYVTGDKFGGYEGDFVYYDGSAMHSNNIDGIMAQAEAYEETKLQNTLDGKNVDFRYISGMYCTENYFDASPASAFFDNYGDAIPVVTHVSITAKLTPRVLVIEDNYKNLMNGFVKKYQESPDKKIFYEEYGLEPSDFTEKDMNAWNDMKKTDGAYNVYFENDTYKFRGFRTIKTNSQTDSDYILKWSLMMNKRWSNKPGEFADNKFSDGTFYVYDRRFDGESYVDENALIDRQRYLCLTAGAVATAKAEDISIKMRSVPHLGGWGYYYTYLDNNPGVQKPAGTKPYTWSQVTRNTYYLITVSNIGSPGGTISRPEYIKVNTESVGWDYAGKGDINLH